jgi:alpha-mannosidase
VLVVDFKPYQPRTFAVRLAPPARSAATNAAPVPASSTVFLPFNLDGMSRDGAWLDGDFDGGHHTIAGELFPSALAIDGVTFTLGSSAPGAKNVLVPAGQTLNVPAGTFNRIYVLASAVGGDVQATIGTGATSRAVTIAEWQGAIGQWNSRLKDLSAMVEPFVPSRPGGVPTVEGEVRDGMAVQWDAKTFAVTNLDQLKPAFVKHDELAWIGTHRHSDKGNQEYVMSYVFAYGIDLPAGAKTITLPTNDRVRIFAITAVREAERVKRN